MIREVATPPEPLAVVAGMRTPFAKAFGPLSHVTADELGRIAVEATLQQAQMKPADIEEVVFGNVAGPAEASNVGRVIALRAGVPMDRVGHTVNRNCASGMEAVFSAWQTIKEQRAEVIVAGGTESMSNVPLLWDPRMRDVLLAVSKEKSLLGKAKALTKMRPSFFKPIPALQLGLTDPTCGLNMGQTAEGLAKDFSISRADQDYFALTSHQRTSAAWKRCFLKGEVVPLTAEQTHAKPLEKDSGPRDNQTLEALGKLKPIFEKDGTVTAGNSCPITDGAAALVLMPAGRAKAEGRQPLGYIRDYAIAGCDPRRMGLGPVFATSKLLRRTGLTLNDFELFEINEAFAAQVLACLKATASDSFAQQQLNRPNALGELDPERLNVNGGAIALGHPVGSSGTRLILTLLRALREKNLKRGLATLCVGGGQGAAVWVETTLDE